MPHEMPEQYFSGKSKHTSKNDDLLTFYWYCTTTVTAINLKQETANVKFIC